MDRPQHDHAARPPVLARAMPWALSLFLHMGLALILLFVFAVLVEAKPQREVPLPVSFAILAPQTFTETRDRFAEGAPRPWSSSIAEKSKPPPAWAADPIPPRGRKEMTGLIPRTRRGPTHGLAARSGKPSLFSPAAEPPPRWPSGAEVDVVYVIDGSGSMVDKFDLVAAELARSISRLDGRHRFHVILFAGAGPIEKIPRRLSFATTLGKRTVVPLIRDHRPSGHTDPAAALDRAFAVLRQGRSDRVRLIFLLTDGAFDDNAKVVNQIAGRNRSKQVTVDTFLFGDGGATAEAVLRRIAAANGGRFTHVKGRER